MGTAADFLQVRNNRHPYNAEDDETAIKQVY